MIWALDLDDFSNRCPIFSDWQKSNPCFTRCGCENYPLLRTINRVLRAYPTPDPQCDGPSHLRGLSKVWILSLIVSIWKTTTNRRSKSWRVSRLLCPISVTRLRGKNQSDPTKDLDAQYCHSFLSLQWASHNQTGWSFPVGIVDLLHKSFKESSK